MEQLMETEKEIKYYAVYNPDTQKLYKAQVKCLNENIINIPITKEIFDNIKAYNYIDGELVYNENYAKEQEELAKKKEAERIAMLNLTGADVERGIYKSKGMDFDDIIAMVISLQQAQDERVANLDLKALKIELKANNFYRGNPYVDAVGSLLGFTSEQLNKFFEYKDYTYLIPVVEETEEVVEEDGTN